MEDKQKNIEITRKKMSGVPMFQLMQEYKCSSANIYRIVRDTKAKYPEALEVTE